MVHVPKIKLNNNYEIPQVGYELTRSSDNLKNILIGSFADLVFGKLVQRALQMLFTMRLRLDIGSLTVLSVSDMTVEVPHELISRRLRQ